MKCVSIFFKFQIIQLLKHKAFDTFYNKIILRKILHKINQIKV